MTSYPTNQLDITKIEFECVCRDCGHSRIIKNFSAHEFMTNYKYVLTTECPICGKHIRKARKKKYGVEMFGEKIIER